MTTASRSRTTAPRSTPTPRPWRPVRAAQATRWTPPPATATSIARTERGPTGVGRAVSARAGILDNPPAEHRREPHRPFRWEATARLTPKILRALVLMGWAAETSQAGLLAPAAADKR